MSALTRRALLGLAGAVPVALAMLSGTANTGDVASESAQASVLRLQDGSLTEHELSPHWLAGPTVARVTLAPDLVQQWRASLGAQVRAAAVPVVALVRWDKALILSGLAREAGLRVQTHRLSRAVFRIDVQV